jgi:Flp pilus assembly protein TadD
MKFFPSVLTVWLGLVLCVSGASAMDRKEKEEPSAKTSPSLAPGRKAVDAKDFNTALQHLTKAAGETPKDADVHNLLGYSYRNLRQFDKALEHYRVALEIDPRHRGANEYIGELYLEMDQPANAEKHLSALSKACLFGCKEYSELKEAIEKYKAKK